ncbi:hypothetical protein J4P02_01220 [Pseudomonas sp. NFXW11]|uniref:GNAT family N-acetyltransferase n=1 Tax=Pseudomonas sp. NFXW11 TaxID=2819531 RepID=UPI003CF25D0E
MTATSFPDQTAANLLPIEPASPAFTFRRGHSEDIERLAELFQSVYGQTTHPCQKPGYIRSSMGSGQQQWFVAEEDGAIVGCTCIARRPWNLAWEVCHGVIRPEARRSGAISHLVGLSLENHQPAPLELGFYITRNIASHALMKKIKPALLVGHDGGPDKVDGIREYHLTAIHPPIRDGFVHVAPWYVREPCADFIGHYLYPSLQLLPAPGNYPQTCLSGAPGGTRHGQLGYTHDAEANALMISGQAGASASEQEVLLELNALLHAWKQVEYVNLHILADKLDLLAELMKLGFAITAYLPAWHLQAGARYDCIMLVRQSFAQAPHSHGFDDEVAFFDQAYARLADGLCSLCPAHNLPTAI